MKRNSHFPMERVPGDSWDGFSFRCSYGPISWFWGLVFLPGFVLLAAVGALVNGNLDSALRFVTWALPTAILVQLVWNLVEMRGAAKVIKVVGKEVTIFFGKECTEVVSMGELEFRKTKGGRLFLTTPNGKHRIWPGLRNIGLLVDCVEGARPTAFPVPRKNSIRGESGPVNGE